MKILTKEYDPERNLFIGRGFPILCRKKALYRLHPIPIRPARSCWLPSNYLVKHRHPVCVATPGLQFAGRNEDSSATEVSPAATASPWVSWSPAILGTSSVFGRFLFWGPLLQRI